MINLTLTITAPPELLAVLSNFTNSIKSAKVVTVPLSDSYLQAIKAVPEQGTQNHRTLSMLPMYNQSNPQATSPVQLQQQAPTNIVQAPQCMNIQNSYVPTAVQAYAMDQLIAATVQIADAGCNVELQNLLRTFGIQALTELSKDRYAEFANQLRLLGAKL